jgi:NADPH:quinone reductase
LTLTGSTLRSRSAAFKAEIAEELAERVWPFFGTGQLRTVTYKVLSMEEAAAAHALMESATQHGKILLKPAGG